MFVASTLIVCAPLLGDCTKMFSTLFFESAVPPLVDHPEEKLLPRQMVPPRSSRRSRLFTQPGLLPPLPGPGASVHTRLTLSGLFVSAV